MRYFAFIAGIICLLFSACQTTMPAVCNTNKNTVPGIAITIQFRNGWFAESDVINVVAKFDSIQNVIMKENGPLISEIQITCFRLPEAEIENIQQMIRQIPDVINLIIKVI